MHPFIPRFSRFVSHHVDGVLLSAVLLLMFTGLIVLLSASNASFVRVSAQLMNMLVALGIMWVFANIPPHYLMRLALPVFVVGCALLRPDAAPPVPLAFPRAAQHPLPELESTRVVVPKGGYLDWCAGSNQIAFSRQETPATCSCS